MQHKKWDAIWLNGKIVTCEHDSTLLKQAAIGVKEGKISWVGLEKDLPGHPDLLAEEIHDMQNRLLTPGLIDCHTHLVYAGNRAHEFEMRLQGASYEMIAREGGGIYSTVSATHAATTDELLKESLVRARALLESGVTTVEIKSGYGLDLENELKILQVADRIAASLPLTVVKTFLGAHTIPKAYRNNPDEYVELICNEMIPFIAKEKRAECVDVFCEKIAFNLEQTTRIFKAAKKAGLAIKCHAEQLSNSGAAALAASYGALSVDHLEYASLSDISALAQSKTVAVILPGAYYFLREKQLPPIKLLREHGIPMAIATDLNPGTSPIQSLLIALNMACIFFGLTPEEALLGATKQAARALGREESCGTLTIGKAADFAIWNGETFSEIIYSLGGKPLWQLVKKGKIITI